MRINNILKEIFYLDIRSLVIFRYLLALANLVCAYSYLSYANALIVGAGVIPSNIATKHSTYFSIFDLSSAYYWPIIIFILFITLSIVFALGYYTRLSSLILYLIALSIENSYTVTGGTVGLRLALIWSIFIPLSRKYLEDSESYKFKKYKLVSIPSSCLLIKACIVYFVAFFNKDYTDWALNNTALYNSLWWGGIATPLGRTLRSYPDITVWLTRFVYLLEFLGPCLLLTPFKNGIFRCISTFLLLGMHLGIQLTMNLEEFPLANFAITFAFMPSIFWDFLDNKLRKLKINNRTDQTYNIKFSYVDIIPAFLIFMLIWKNLFFFNIAPKLPNYLNVTLDTLRMKEKWAMFSGGGTYYRFWPVVRLKNINNKDIDLWRWYLGKEDISYKETIPEDLETLTPNIRWEKYITNISMYRGTFGEYQESFIQFLCRSYITSLKEKKILTSSLDMEVELIWGWQVVNGINNFSIHQSGILKNSKCKFN